MTTEQVVEIELDALHPDEKNPRRKAAGGEGWKEFVASIKESGVLVPLLVRPNREGFTIVAGHRRHAGSREAGRKTVPCIVREMTDEEVAVERIIENDQRLDLDAVEQATSYFRANELGMTPAALAAKIGRSKSFVVDRIKLLDLPAQVLALVKKGDVSPADALKVHKYLGSRSVEALVRAAQSRDVEWALKQEEQREKRAAKAQAERERAEGYGARFVDLTGGHTLPAGVKKLADYELTPAECKGQPWLCFTMPRSWGGEPERVEYLTDDTKATKAFKKEKDPEFGKLTDEQIANRAKSRELREADAERLAALQAAADVKRGLSGPEKDDVVFQLARSVAGDLRYDDAYDTARIAGIEPPEGKSWSRQAWEWREACMKLAATDVPRFCRAFRLMVLEHAFRNHAAGKVEQEALQAQLKGYNVKDDARAKQSRKSR